MCRIERGWVVWVRPERPENGRFTGPGDWLPAFVDGGPGDSGDLWWAEMLANILDRPLWLARVVGTAGGPWRVVDWRETPIDPDLRRTFNRPVPPWVLARVADLPQRKRRALWRNSPEVREGYGRMSGQYRGWWRVR